MRQVLALLGLLVTQGCGAGHFSVPCSYWAADPNPTYVDAENCAVRSGGAVQLAPEHLKRLNYQSNGLAWIILERRFYYVRTDGRTLEVITFDNGPDEFREGLVRTLVGGKIAYFDVALRQVIPPEYDWGFPFEDGVATVCNGCKLAPPDGDEHRPIVGGLWGCIDTTGTAIVPVAHTDDRKPSCAF